MQEIIEKKTKLIWSLDCRVFSPVLVHDILEEKWDGVRLVYDKKSASFLLDFLQNLKGQKPQDRTPFSMLLDIAQNVRANIGESSPTLEVKYGEEVMLYKKEQKNKDGIFINTEDWDSLFSQDAAIYLGYGDVILTPKKLNNDGILCEVKQGGTIKSNQEIHVPLTRKNQEIEPLLKINLKEFLSLGCNYLIIPGGLGVSDINKLKSHVQKLTDKPVWFLLKVDSIEVRNHLADLIDSVHGVYISRKEISLTASPAIVPILTKEIIQFCSNRGKLVITASDMLASMRDKASPTRAEVSDIANSVSDGTDAVVLSEELSYGNHHVAALRLMHTIVTNAEADIFSEANWQRQTPPVNTEIDAIALAAFQTAKRINAKALVCITINGNTALHLSSFRPPIPIIAVTFKKEVARVLSMVRGVSCLCLDINPTIDEVLPKVNEILKKEEAWLRVGDSIVFVALSLSPLGTESSNLVTIQKIT